MKRGTKNGLIKWLIKGGGRNGIEKRCICDKIRLKS